LRAPGFQPRLTSVFSSTHGPHDHETNCVPSNTHLASFPVQASAPTLRNTRSNASKHTEVVRPQPRTRPMCRILLTNRSKKWFPYQTGGNLDVFVSPLFMSHVIFSP